MSADQFVPPGGPPGRSAGAVAVPERLVAWLAGWWAGLDTRRAVLAASMVAVVSCGGLLGRQPLSWDEAVTASAARHTLSRLAALLNRTDAPLGGYYLAMHGWLRLLGALRLPADEAWLRLPSAVAAVAAVALTALLAARWFGPRVGLTAGVLLAVQPMLVFYAHDARPYALVTAGMVGAALLFGRALERPSAGRLAAYGLVAAGCAYLHLFGALALLVHAAVAARRSRPRWRWILVYGLLAAAVVPLLLVSSGQTGELAWIPPLTPGAVASVLSHVFGGIPLVLGTAATVLTAALRPTRPSWQLAAPDLRPGRGLAALRRLWAGGTAGRPWGPLVGWLVVPVGLLVVGDVLRPVLVARYALPVVPALAVLVAALVAARGGRTARALLAATVLVAALTSTVQLARPYKYEDYRSATDAVTDAARPGDGVVFLPASFRVGYVQYLREPGERPDGAEPADLALRPGDGPDAASQIGGSELPPPATESRMRLARRIFLYGLALPVADRTRRGRADRAKELALAGYHQLWRRHFGQVDVTLFSR
jgi:mannosyltransferase